MTARGTRKGEPSLCSMRNGLRPQPARLVRGSSRRIMAMRFQPANIRVINRRASCSLLSALLSHSAKGERNQRFLSPLESPFFPQRSSKLTSRNVFPLRRPSPTGGVARTVLAVKGSLRRAKPRRALDCCAPFRPEGNCDGRLRREHFSRAAPRQKRRLPSSGGRRDSNKICQARSGLDWSLHIRTLAAADTGLPEEYFPDSCPYPIEAILDSDYLP